MNTQIAMVLQGLDIVVGTPGRILDLASNGSLQLKKITKLVVDEVDETLSLGFRHQLLRIFDFLPAKRQNMVFSATLSEEVAEFLEANFTAPIRVEAARSGSALTQIDQIGYRVPNFISKVELLNYLLENMEDASKVLIFVSSRALADLLFEQLEPIFETSLGVIHSNKAQNFRFKSVQDFQVGVHRILIATDLIARGIDVSDVSHVINFDIPEVPENYIHRIGRTGRADKNGTAITFVSEKDAHSLSNIEELMRQQLPFSPVPEGPSSVGGSMRVGHASSLDEALTDAQKISTKNNRGAWAWETPEDFTTNLGKKPKQGKLLGRMIGDEWFPIEQ
jgi:ATP-dependent RNA helicase RhlE